MYRKFKNLVKKFLKERSIQIFNEKDWTPYLNKNNKIGLYYEGLNKTKQIETDNFSKQLRFYTLIQLMEILCKKNIINKGNFVECGCWKGHSSYVISKILKKNKFKKNFYIFDSFEGGLSNFSYKDRNKRQKLDKKDELKIINYFSSEEKNVLKVLKNFKFVKIFKGWIPKRFDEIKDKKIIFLHLDVDLYKPTLDTLNYFYKNLIPGGVVVCDDYNHSNFPGAKKAWDEFFFLGKKNYSFFYEVPLGGCFLIK